MSEASKYGNVFCKISGMVTVCKSDRGVGPEMKTW